MNGQFQQTIENGRVTIDAYPGSTVTVTEAGSPVTSNPRAAARIDVEDFYFNATSPYTEVNLEQSQGGWAADLSYDHVTGKLAFVNGAMLADVQLYPVGPRPVWQKRLASHESPRRERLCAYKARFLAEWFHRSRIEG